MIFLICALIGLLVGGYTAKKRGGKLADILQYAVAYAIAFALVGVIATIIIDKFASSPVG